MDHQLQRHIKIDKCCNEIMRTRSCDDSSSAELEMELRRGPWTVEEDLTLINYIALHGEGRWNSLARSAGLKRTGKSCRLRWLNYLRPDVRRGNITLEEQLLILELHSRWGNRWSKIAQHLPGRTDNEIKNYWRTRVQKHAKQLKCDVNSKQFKDTMRYLWMPRLLERRIQQANNHQIVQMRKNGYASENSSSDSFGTTECYNNNNNNHKNNDSSAHHHDNGLVADLGINHSQDHRVEYYHATSQQQQQLIFSSSSSSSYNGDHRHSSSATTVYLNDQSGFDFTEDDHQYNQWMDGSGDHLALSESDSLWNNINAADDNIWNI